MCQRQAKLLLQAKSQFDAAGYKLVMIGNGTLEQAQKFQSVVPFHGEMYLDPKDTTYKLFGLKKYSGFAALKRYVPEISAMKKIVAGESGHNLKGKSLQHGGVVAIGAGANARPTFVWKEEDYGVDVFCTPEEVLRSISSGAPYGSVYGSAYGPAYSTAYSTAYTPTYTPTYSLQPTVLM